jgi:hypothetical protein
MDKLSAYNQGVIEGLSTLDLPQNIKLAAARYLLGAATVKEASLGGLSINNIVNKARQDVSTMGSAPLVDLDQRDRDFEKNISSAEQLDSLELAQALAREQEERDMNATPYGPSMAGMGEDYGPSMVGMGEDYGPSMVGMGEDYGPSMAGMGDPYGPPISGMGGPSYLQTALRLARENPEMAAAAGLGAAGLGYGAYRALN